MFSTKTTTTMAAIIAAASLAFTLTACSPRTATVADEKPTTAPADAVDAAEPEPEPEPVPEFGTLANPAPAGTVASVEQGDGTTFDIAFTGVDMNANAAVANENQFNDAAAPGHHYVIIGATITNTTPDAAKALRPGSAAYGMTLTDYATKTSYSQVSVVLPGDLSSATEIYQGQTATGNVAFMVPDSATNLVVGIGGVFAAL